MDENLQDTHARINDLPEDNREHSRNALQELQNKERFNIKCSAKSLRASADKLDELWWDCKIAHAAGTTAGIASGCLTLLSATALTGGATTPFLLVGLGLGLGGAVTNLGTSCIEASIISAEIKKAEKLLKTTLDSIEEVNTTVQRRPERKEMARLLYILFLAQSREFVDSLLMNFLSEVISAPFGLSINLMKKFAALAQGEGKAVAQVAVQAGNAGLQGADDVSQVGKAGIQAADDMAQAGTKAATKTVGKVAEVLAAANIAFLLVDCLDLRLTIRDLLENKGSEAAKGLRQKAKELEDFLEQ